MADDGKDTKHTRNISIRMHFVINGEKCNMHETVWCEGGLQLEVILTKNVRGYGLNTRLGYTMVGI